MPSQAYGTMATQSSTTKAASSSKSPSPHQHSPGYTASPLQLIKADVFTFLCLVPHLLDVIRPLTPFPSKEYDELYPKTSGNILSLLQHFILFILQAVFLISLPFTIVFPIGFVALYIGAFLLINKLLCFALNGKAGTLDSDPGVLRQLGDHGNEKWIFINGVSVGHHWLQTNINRLSLTFQRPITGVHNRTAGIIFDVIEVLIERTFDYCTTDVRNGYLELRTALCSKDIKKVVLILHSQGGVQGSLIVDWLLDQLSTEQLAKLEVYTFGCAANHFNNPRVREPATARRPYREAINYIEHYANTDDFVARWGILNAIHPLRASKNSWWMRLEAMNAGPSRWRKSMAGAEVKKNTGCADGNEHTGYQGRIFELPLKGHMLNQHYLSQLFPLIQDRVTGRWKVETDPARSLMGMKIKIETPQLEGNGELDKDRVRMSEAKSPFMRFNLGLPARSKLDRVNERSAPAGNGESSASGMTSIDSASHAGSSNGPTEQQQSNGLSLSIDDSFSSGSFNLGQTGQSGEGLKVKDWSRLWLYVDGGSPAESPVELRKKMTF